MVDFTLRVKEIVEKIDLNLEVQDIVGNKVFLCKTLFLAGGYKAINSKVEDTQGNKYEVTDFLDDKWIVLEPLEGAPDPFNDDFVVCPSITCLHGTPSSVNDEYIQLGKRSGTKLPLVWLNENYRLFEGGRMSTIEYDVKPQIFFLDQTKEDSWTNAQHHRFTVKPMSNLADAFMQVVHKDKKYKTIREPLEKTPRSRIGQYETNQGNEGKIIDEKLSGVEIQPNMSRYKSYTCDC